MTKITCANCGKVLTEKDEIEYSKYHPELYGKQVYPNWRIDKNISWFNLQSLIGGFIFANLTLMFLWNWKDYKIAINPFNTKYWLPLRYARNYHTIYYDVDDAPVSK